MPASDKPNPATVGAVAVATPLANQLKYCVVCGQGSHRDDWVKKSGPFVACDYHEDKEIAEAAKQPTKAATDSAKVRVAAAHAAGQEPDPEDVRIAKGTAPAAPQVAPAPAGAMQAQPAAKTITGPNEAAR